MSASEHVNPRQLRLFIQAHELMDYPSSDTKNNKPLSKDARTREQKVRQSYRGDAGSTYGFHLTNPRMGKTLYESVKEKGVQTPITLEYQKDDDSLPTITDGHHRVAIAHEINPEMYIPVEYEEPYRLPEKKK